MRELAAVFYSVLKRDLQIYLQHKSECLAIILFYLIVVSLFPLVLGQFAAEQLWLVPCILWIAVLLAVVLAQGNLLREDFKLGIFEQFVISPYPLSLLVLAKVLANWLVTGLPLILLTPLLAVTFALPAESVIVITITLILGTPVLSLLAAIAAAMTVSLANGGVLLAVILLPLYVPILILGVSAGILSLQGMPCNGQLALLAAGSIAALILAPVAVSAIIRVSTT